MTTNPKSELRQFGVYVIKVTVGLSRHYCRHFSTNFRKFRLDEAALGAMPCRWEEITERTVPEDFGRRRPHRCWRLVREGGR